MLKQLKEIRVSSVNFFTNLSRIWIKRPGAMKNDFFFPLNEYLLFEKYIFFKFKLDNKL